MQAIGRKRAGGNEHDVYIVGTSPNRVVIRSTVKDSYGFPFASPAQYLQRMADYNATFPHLAIEILGVSRAPVLGKLSDEHGNGVIWTAQPFVEGREFADQGDLNAAMQANGWDRVSELEFRHRETGTVIGDAHTGNVLQTRDGKLAPIDVIVRRLPEGVDGTGDVGAGGAAGGRGAAVPADVGRLGKARGALDAQPGP